MVFCGQRLLRSTARTQQFCTMVVIMYYGSYYVATSAPPQKKTAGSKRVPPSSLSITLMDIFTGYTIDGARYGSYSPARRSHAHGTTKQCRKMKFITNRNCINTRYQLLEPLKPLFDKLHVPGKSEREIRDDY